MFLGREQELQALEKMYDKNNFQMAVVYGRRRIGKTSLYFPAEEVNDYLNLEKFSKISGEKSPLFGRRTGQLKITPLDYYDAAMFYPNASDKDKVKYYATIGGTPYYLSLIDDSLTFEENLKELYFNINGYLLNEGVLLMKQEFREPANYNAVLQAIASGANVLNEIAGFTKLENSLISKYLLTLQELNYIERVIPFGANPLKGKKGQYRITENFIAFWYRYIFSIRSEIERGYGDIYFSSALDNLNEFIGSIFEEITLQYLRRQNSQGALPFIAKSFGKWWGKDKSGQVQEIDIILESMSGQELLIGECKWQSNIKMNKVMNTLNQRGDIFNHDKIYKYLFTKVSKQLASEDIITVSLSDYYQ